MGEVEDIRLSDFLREDLDIIIVGINPGIVSATHGRHYAGPGNHFWPCLFKSGLITEPLTAREDNRIVEFGIGLTNICERPTKSSSDLSAKELKEGGVALRQRLIKFAPKIVVFNGKIIYQYFSGLRPSAIEFGLQSDTLLNSKNNKTILFVMPSSSPRCSNYPRADDKLPFYCRIKELRDQVICEEENLVTTNQTDIIVNSDQPDPKQARKATSSNNNKAFTSPYFATQ